MDKDAFKRKMDDMGISRQWYHIDDYGNDDERFCVNKVDGKWLVYYGERGSKYEIKEFEREENAYTDLVNRLTDERDRQRRNEERTRHR